MRRAFVVLLAVAMLMVSSVTLAAAAGGNRNIGINVVLRQDITDAILADLARFGTVNDTYPDIDALTMKVRESNLATVKALPYVAAANADAMRVGKPVPMSPYTDTIGGWATWDQDAINVNDAFTDTRSVAETGAGVYVAVLDTGLLSTWRYYFNEARVAEEYAIAFGGGGGEHGNVSTQPNKWQTDQNSHGTHVTSSIIGYRYTSAAGVSVAVDGASPEATIIPVKVLNQNGSGWSSMVAKGITYVADLKAEGGPLEHSPVVINMSLGGPALDVMEQEAIDYAIRVGVIIVASAGNEGEAGMGYPGAYGPVISAAASGWIGEWTAPGWWNSLDVAEPTVATDFYITDFSSRQLTGQDLDVAAPGSWVVGPYQVNGQLSYFYLGGTSMASPHVAGVVALMAEKKSTLTAAEAEIILTSTAITLGAGTRSVVNPNTGASANITWGADASGAGLMNAAAALEAITP